MCQIFAHTDPILYESRTHSFRLHGVTTNVRLENLFWQMLAEMAAAESMTTNQLLAKLHDEVHAFRGDFGNFASFLRVTCLRWQTLRAGADSGLRADLARGGADAVSVSASEPGNLRH